MEKLAVFFPGIGYTADKPLLHFSRRLARDAGFEVLILPYSGFPEKVKGDRGKMAESYRIALSQTEEMLSGINFSDYDAILFVGKSIGTIAAAEIAAKNNLHGRIHFVMYTPLEDTFAFPLENAVVFTGDADPWVRESAIPERCKKKGLPCHVIPGANHSLESGNVEADIVNLEKIMKETRKFICSI